MGNNRSVDTAKIVADAYGEFFRNSDSVVPYFCDVLKEVYKDNLHDLGKYLCTFKRDKNPTINICLEFKRWGKGSEKVKAYQNSHSEYCFTDRNGKKRLKLEYQLPSELLIPLYEEKYKEEPDKKKFVSNLLKKMDATAMCTFLENIGKSENTKLINIFNNAFLNKKQIVMDDFSKYITIIRIGRNDNLGHLSEWSKEHYDFEKNIDAFETLKKVVSIIKTNATSERSQKIIDTIDTDIKDFRRKPLDVSLLKKKYPKFDVDNGFKCTIWEEKFDKEKNLLYFTDINDQKLNDFIKNYNKVVYKKVLLKEYQNNKLPRLLQLSNSTERRKVLSTQDFLELIDNADVFFDIGFWLDSNNRSAIVNIATEYFQKAKLFIGNTTRDKINAYDKDNSDENEGKQKAAHEAMKVYKSLHKSTMIQKIDFHHYGKSEDEIFYVALLHPEKRYVLYIPNESKTKQEYNNKIKNYNIHNLLLVTYINGRSVAAVPSNLEDFANNKHEELISVEKKEFSEKDDKPKDIERKSPKEVKQDKQKKDDVLTDKNKSVSIKQPFKAASSIPEGKDQLFTEDGTKITLVDVLGKGGEGAVYTTNQRDVVAKIYNEKIDENRYKKLCEMTQIPYMKNICMPLHILFNSKEEVVGYLMEQVPSNYKTLQESILQLNNSGVQEMYPSWNRLSIVNACTNICVLFKKLHEKQVLMGDVNPGNIMVNMDNPNNPDVYFVDCESMQYKNYTCPVGQVGYTNPKIYKRYNTENPVFSEVIRTKNDELYSIAALLFRILFFGSGPYISKGASDTKQAMIDYNFAYRSEYSTGKDTPEGPNRLIWNNTFKPIRENFAEVFANKKFVSIEKWIDDFKTYSRMIKKGNYTDELLPRLYWDNENHEYNDYFTCINCNREGNMPKNVYAMKIKNGIPPLCRECEDALMVAEAEWKEKREIYDAHGYLTKEDKETVELLNQPYLCDGCHQYKRIGDIEDAIFRNLQNWNITKKTYCEDCLKPRTVSCEWCGKEYTEKEYRYKLIKGNNKQKLICNDCWKKEEVKCEACGEVFQKPKWLIEKSKHYNDRILCDSCRSK